jgi:hypothetical protein
MPKKTTPTVIKEESMEIQKKMIAENFRQLYEVGRRLFLLLFRVI